MPARSASAILHAVLTCVIVDDSPSVLSDAKALLQRQGLDVVGVASSQAEALDVIARTHPDVALVDVDLGPESGFEVVRAIKTDPATAGTDCILISTHSEADFPEMIEASPALGFIGKVRLSAAAISRLVSDARDT
jgi:DNA-binding NarL/FixJ family response regulator